MVRAPGKEPHQWVQDASMPGFNLAALAHKAMAPQVAGIERGEEEEEKNDKTCEAGKVTVSFG